MLTEPAALSDIVLVAINLCVYGPQMLIVYYADRLLGDPRSASKNLIQGKGKGGNAEFSGAIRDQLQSLGLLSTRRLLAADRAGRKRACGIVFQLPIGLAASPSDERYRRSEEAERLRFERRLQHFESLAGIG